MIVKCRACGSYDLTQFVDLGEQHLSDFRDDPSRPPAYPLRLLFCRGCTLVQLSETVPRELMYTDAYGFYSGVNEGIRADLASVVHQALGIRPDARSWLDIASNDGTLLAAVPDRIYTVGVDPVKKFAELARTRADVIISDYFSAEAVAQWHGAFDVVSSISMFYDVDDPGALIDDVYQVMAPHGIWIVQQNYVGDMVGNTVVDNICHEHITYFGLTSLCRLLADHHMRVVAASVSPVNGGSFRTVIVKEHNTIPADASVNRMLVAERQQGLGQMASYYRFAQAARDAIFDIRTTVEKANAAHQRVFIYAASTRGATLWQAAELTERDCPFAVERNTAKVGKYFSPVGCKIISEEEARDLAPDFFLVGPWWFRDQIINRERQFLLGGGKMIFPLPRLEVVGRTGRTIGVV